MSSLPPAYSSATSYSSSSSSRPPPALPTDQPADIVPQATDKLVLVRSCHELGPTSPNSSAQTVTNKLMDLLELEVKGVKEAKANLSIELLEGVRFVLRCPGMPLCRGQIADDNTTFLPITILLLSHHHRRPRSSFLSCLRLLRRRMLRLGPPMLLQSTRVKGYIRSFLASNHSSSSSETHRRSFCFLLGLEGANLRSDSSLPSFRSASREDQRPARR
jgi:hypothetical protein